MSRFQTSLKSNLTTLYQKMGCESGIVAQHSGREQSYEQTSKLSQLRCKFSNRLSLNSGNDFSFRTFLIHLSLFFRFRNSTATATLDPVNRNEFSVASCEHSLAIHRRTSKTTADLPTRFPSRNPGSKELQWWIAINDPMLTLSYDRHNICLVN